MAVGEDGRPDAQHFAQLVIELAVLPESLDHRAVRIPDGRRQRLFDSGHELHLRSPHRCVSQHYTAPKRIVRTALMTEEALQRCPWPLGDPLMLEYHDTEWGIPLHDDHTWYEYLVLDAAQAGLSWRTVLYRR